MSGDWATAKIILDKRHELVRFAISEDYCTALHVAASVDETKRTETFVEHLVGRMERKDLELENSNSNTALFLAAAAGNVKVVKIMMKKNRGLAAIAGSQGMLPLHIGAIYGRHNVVEYLYYASLTMIDVGLTSRTRGWLLLKCVECDLFVVIHTKLRSAEKMDTDALKLLRFIWRHIIKRMAKDQVTDMLNGPPTYLDDGTKRYRSRMLFVAAEMGNTSFVVELLRAYPDLMWKVNDDNRTIFHIAIMHRHQGIYNLLLEIGSMKDLILQMEDADGNNMLHLVGMTTIKMRHKTSEASLLMQRELLWFSEVEKTMPSTYRERKNKGGQTPYELFSENNQDVISEGLKWMKDCMVVATLIVTVAFAVAFTVPGGYDQGDGIPVFIHERTFIVFVIADAILCSLPQLHSWCFYLSSHLVTTNVTSCIRYPKRLKWVPIVIAIFAALPVIMFASLQLPLLVDMFRSMHDSRYLFNPRRRNDRVLK
ncbi:Ankyrin repeat-containing protein [Cynara cardunculus var. scolymus]|uniref:Ankyrin repeat-containing protein n=1 Tax=Cynara cardunculus var. scolymus TaxID=59895 RepID=A0A103Y9I9_CYNCS|nr:Ankyrin repeat-containing protein [Cynara cardunculus var. scolymus]